MKLKDLFFPDESLAPKVIIFSYWVLLSTLLLAFSPLFYVVVTNFFAAPKIGTFYLLMFGLLSFLSSILLVRFGLELFFALFRIHQSLQKLDEKETH